MQKCRQVEMLKSRNAEKQNRRYFEEDKNVALKICRNF